MRHFKTTLTSVVGFAIVSIWAEFGCGTKVAPVRWAQPLSKESVLIAVVGAHTKTDRVEDVLVQLNPDLVVYTGVDSRTEVKRGDWEVMALSTKQPSAAWMKRFPGMGGDDPNPYGSLDIIAGSIQWRLLYLTTYDEPIARWNEQSYWLPKALPDSEFDRLIVLLDRPRYTTGETVVSGGARVLVDEVQDNVKPLTFPLVISGGTLTNEFFLPGGRFGEAHLIAGTSTVRGAEFGGVTGGLFNRAPLESSFLNAVRTSKSGSLEDVRGIWLVRLTGENLSVSFMQQNDEENWEMSYKMLRDGSGWHPPR